MKRLMYALAACLFLLSGVVPAGAQESEVARLKEKIIEIQNKSELGFKNFVLCKNIIGYGQYVEVENNRVKPGTKIYFYFEPANLYTNCRKASYHVWYTQDMILLDEKGEVVFQKPEALNFNYQTSSPVLDYYATNSLSLGNLPPGNYTYKAVIHDKLKNREAAYLYDFEIVK